jgi:hypothetical protein
LKADAVRWANLAEQEADKKGLSNDFRTLECLTVDELGKRYKESVLPRKRAAKNQAIILDAFLRSPIARTRLSDINPWNFVGLMFFFFAGTVTMLGVSTNARSCQPPHSQSQHRAISTSKLLFQWF